MDAVFDLLDDVLGDNLILSLLVFLAAAVVSFGIMATMRARRGVRRRAAGVLAQEDRAASRSMRYASQMAARRLIDYASRHFSASENDNQRELKRRLVRAGFLDPRAAAFFFLARILTGLGLAVATLLLAPAIVDDPGGDVWFFVWAAGLACYFGPNFYLKRRIRARENEHRAGFPDFMDLLVVCADAGLSMEAALDRVGRELSDSYPSLSANVYMATLEIRAGRTLSEALEHFGDRLGLDEARSFATLLQQSEELGSSLTDALRVYSDDMRHQRLSRAEEKAYSLPAKLSVPLTLCVFPVVIIVIMLPVYVRFKVGG
jgi:tight adherence protein C